MPRTKVRAPARRSKRTRTSRAQAPDQETTPPGKPGKLPSTHPKPPAVASPDALLALALVQQAEALRSRDPSDAMLARLLDAAELVKRRSKAGAESAQAELRALDRAAAKYAATRTAGERIAFAALPPRPYERAAAIRALHALAMKGLRKVRAATPPKREGVARVVAAVLLEKVDEVGLAQDRVVRAGSPLHHELIGVLLDARTREDRVCALALQCCGVSRSDAANWTRSALIG